jgi:hypothetical protein
VFRDGVLCFFDEGFAASDSGDARRAMYVEIKGVVLMAGSAIAAGTVIAAIAEAGLTAAAFGPAGWILAVVLLAGLLIDCLADIFGEPKTFLTSREDDLSRALAWERQAVHANGKTSYLSRSCARLNRMTEALSWMLQPGTYLLDVEAMRAST